jgi:hypothetical protein
MIPNPFVPSKQARSILMLAVGIMASYILLIRVGGSRAELAESNLQANLIRISRYEYERPAEFVIAGSSIAGRLLPAYFQEHGMDVQNLGLDGSCPLFAFEVISRRQKLPKTILVDTSTLFQPILPNSIVLREAIQSPGWSFSSWFIPFRPTSRPSSILYSWFKSQKESRVAGIEKSAYPTSSVGVVPVQTSRVPLPVWKAEDQYVPVRKYLEEYRSKGVSVCLVNIPRGEGWGVPSNGLERKLADEMHIPLVEIGPELAKQGVKLSFSDGMHLDVPSARRIVAEFAKILK